MRKGYLLVLLACLFAVPAFGVPSHENYIGGDNDVIGKWMHTYYGTWTPGQSPAGGSENENFFIGRVRPLKRFTNTATQVIQDNDENITRRMNRKLLWWVPIGENDNGGWTSTPSFSLDAEVFNMWSYITIYGNWTQGFFRQPGAFADACHKNGVLTSVVSAAPWAETQNPTDGGHGQNYKALVDGGADKLLKLMSYYGIDGLGFNSEQSWGGGLESSMRTLMQNCHTNKGNYAVGDRLHFDMYDLDSQYRNSGSTSCASDVDGFFPYSNGHFLNYNWGASALSTAASSAGANSFDIYAGMDQQGRTFADWLSLKNYNISIGLWGAHNKNMIFLGSTEDGSQPEAIQNCYLRKSEQFFTGGTRNPANASNNPISNDLGTGNASFFGVSQLMAAKSALSWVVNDYFPFISYMNLGAGKFFNNEGETTFDHEWYNIGMQDHLPTWRWWITDKYMGHSASDVPTDTKATFTYEDAWFGGSCMKVTFDAAVTGTTNARYIQLYKTEFPINEDDAYTLRVRYKVLQGSAAMHYMLSTVGAEGTATRVPMGTMNKTEWTVLEKDLPTSFNNGTIAQIGMAFQNIKAGTEILIGEVALVKNGVTYDPVLPEIDTERTKILATTHKGVDFKVIWNCEKPATVSSAPIQKATMATVKATITNATTNMSPYTMDWDNNHEIATVYDGNTGTYFWSNNSQKTGEYIAVDLGQVYDLDNIKFYFTSGDQPNGGKVQISTDGSKYTDVKTFTNADINSSTNYLISCSATGQKARYVRFYNSDPDVEKWFQMSEIEVYIIDGSGSGSGEVEPSTGTISANGAPIYNVEVDTWYFEVWGEQDGKEAQLLTTTTTWAGYAVRVPFDLNVTDKRYRAGVRAVAPDGVTKSEIAWTDWMDASDITILEDIVCDKPVIKPNEEFSVYFEDPNHAAGNWVISNSATGEKVAEKNGTTIVTFGDGLANVGSYDVTIDGVTIPGLIQISPESTGAMPDIYTLRTDKTEIMGNHSEQAIVSFTSRDADGTVSKGLRVGDPNAFVARINSADANASATEFAKTAPYTYCMWFKVTDLIHSTQGINLLYKTDFTCDWPQNNWGEFWCQIRPKGTAKSPSGTCLENELSFNVCGWSAHDNARDGMTSGSSLQKGVWYHMAVSLDNGGMERMWINGKLVAESQNNSVYGNGCQSGSSTNSGAFTRKFTRLYVGASGTYKAGFNGVIDEIQCWDKVLTTDEVRTAMLGYQKGSAPTNLKGYWTFDEMVSKNINDTARMVFPNWGTGTEEAVGYYSTTPTVNSDGESRLDNLIEKYLGDFPDAGCPLIPGQYVVETTPTWSYIGGEGSITSNGYTTTSGSATVSNGVDVDPFRVKLVLENSWGKSEEKYVDIVVKDWTVGLDQAVAPKDLTVYPNPFVERISMLFPQEGEYLFAVMNLEGKCVNTQSRKVAAGEVVDMQIDGEAGMYILQIRTKNDVLLQSVKIEKK